MLQSADFKHIVECAPLVAIDVILKNSSGKYFLGYRKNRPAMGYWFVPGGRIFKNEKFITALSRVIKSELSIEFKEINYSIKGVYEHLYSDSCFYDIKSGTHYIVIAVEIELDLYDTKLPDNQHSQLKFFDVNDLLNDPCVHPYTKAYFIETPYNKIG